MIGRLSTRRLMGWTAAVAVILAATSQPASIVAAWRLVFGWMSVAGRIIPDATVRPGSLAALAGLVGFAVAVDRAARRWFPGEWRPTWTIRLAGGLLLMMVAGLAAAGVLNQAGHLVFDGKPWTQRYYGQRAPIRSASNLRQIGLGLAQYANEHHRFPPGATFDEHGTPLHGWPTLILPYVDNLELHQAIDFARPWDDPAQRAGISNHTATAPAIGIYKIPGVFEKGSFLGYATNAWVIGGERPLSVRDFPDGTSTTILAGEAAGEYRPWGYPVHWRDPELGINRSPAGFGGPFPGGANFLFADGSVHFLRNKLPMRVFRALATPDGGEAVDTGMIDP